jgi:hypothetical protein
MSYNLDTVEVLDGLFDYLSREVFPNMHSDDAKKVIDGIESYGKQTDPEWNIGDSI